MSFRLTEAADHDIERILQDTLELFGPYQFQAYSDLIDQALQLVGTNPHGLGTSRREASDLAFARFDWTPSHDAGVRRLTASIFFRRRTDEGPIS